MKQLKLVRSKSNEKVSAFGKTPRTVQFNGAPKTPLQITKSHIRILNEITSTQNSPSKITLVSQKQISAPAVELYIEKVPIRRRNNHTIQEEEEEAKDKISQLQTDKSFFFVSPKEKALQSEALQLVSKREILSPSKDAVCQTKKSKNLGIFQYQISYFSGKESKVDNCKSINVNLIEEQKQYMKMNTYRTDMYKLKEQLLDLYEENSYMHFCDNLQIVNDYMQENQPRKASVQSVRRSIPVKKQSSMHSSKISIQSSSTIYKEHLKKLERMSKNMR